MQSQFQIFVHTVTPTSHIIRRYIQERYARWLDYSKYHCDLTGLHDESVDLLNEVLISLLKKDESKLLELYSKKKGKYREIDYYVLRMVKLNVTSPLAPYRWKHKPIPKNENVEISTLSLVDFIQTTEDFEDQQKAYDRQTKLIQWVLRSADFTEFERDVFNFYMSGGKFEEWPGGDTLRKLSSTFMRTGKIIHAILYRSGFSANCPKRMMDSIVVKKFIKTHKIVKNKKLLKK